MRDLQGIAEINGPNRAAFTAERIRNTSGKQQRDQALTRADHGARIAARNAINNTPFRTAAAAPEYLGMEGIFCAIDQKSGSPFMNFWHELNKQRGAEVRYGEARSLFNGGPTPANALTYVENGDGFRAVPAPPVQGREAWYGEHREITDNGTKWHRVANEAGNAISYSTPTAALDAAVWVKGNAIQKAFR